MKNWLSDCVAAIKSAVHTYSTRRYWRMRGFDMDTPF